jgi:hypothetical protein
MAFQPMGLDRCLLPTITTLAWSGGPRTDVLLGCAYRHESPNRRRLTAVQACRLAKNATDARETDPIPSRRFGDRATTAAESDELLKLVRSEAITNKPRPHRLLDQVPRSDRADLCLTVGL